MTRRVGAPRARPKADAPAEPARSTEASPRAARAAFDEIIAFGERRTDYEKMLAGMAGFLMREQIVARSIARAPTKYKRKKMREWHERDEAQRLAMVDAAHGVARTPAQRYATVLEILGEIADIEPAMRPVLKLVATLGPRVLTDPTEHIRREIEARAATEGRSADGKRGARTNRKLQRGHALALLALDNAREGGVHASFEVFAMKHGRDTGQPHVEKFEGRKAASDGDKRMTERGLRKFLERQDYLSDSVKLTPDDERRGRSFRLGSRRHDLEHFARAFRRAE